MIRLALSLFFAVSLAHAGRITVVLDSATFLNDGTTFTSGTTYHATFQLIAGTAGTSNAAISLIALGGGSPVASSPADPTAGNFLIGPVSASADGIFQSSGTLALYLDPANAYSLFSQQFVAGTQQFRFTAALAGLFAGGVPDSFAFQLYDALRPCSNAPISAP